MSVTCDLYDSLGKQLFMIFNTMNISFEYNKPFWFKKEKEENVYWKTIFSNLQIFVIDIEYNNDTICLEEKDYSYVKEIGQEYSICFNGYFQSIKYFQNNYKKIYNFIDFENKKEKLFLKINNFKIFNFTSIHFKLDKDNLLTYNYYKNSIETINQNNFIFFYKNENEEYIENMINEIKKDFPHKEYILSKQFNLDDWEELLLMSLCCNNIISNSIFSWWGAFLNTNENKKIIYPNLWFNKKDMFPKDWKNI
jgi:hypothetical protein